MEYFIAGAIVIQLCDMLKKLWIDVWNSMVVEY